MSFRITPVHRSWSVARTRAFTTLVVFAVLVVCLRSPNAAQPTISQREAASTITTKEFTGNVDDDWADAGNWNPNGVPQNGDHVIIPAGLTCRVRSDDARADSFEVQLGGLLLIHHQLTIRNDSEVIDESGVELVREHPNDPEAPTLVIDGDVVLSGSGSIRGKEADSRIIIPPYHCLVNEARIEGVLRILGPQTLNQATNLAQGTLANGGEIIANAAGNLVIESTITIANHTTPAEWKVAQNASAGLILQASASPLNDSFVIVLGTLRISTPIVTSGDLTQDGGLLDLEADLTVHHPNYPLSTSLYTFNGGSGNVACDIIFSYDDFTGTQENPDNTKDEDPPYEVVGPPCGG